MSTWKKGSSAYPVIFLTCFEVLSVVDGVIDRLDAFEQV